MTPSPSEPRRAEAAPPPKHRPEFRDDVPTGWCECGQTYPHIIINAGTPESRETLDVDSLFDKVFHQIESESRDDYISVTHVADILDQHAAALRSPDTEGEDEAESPPATAWSEGHTTPIDTETAERP